MFITQIRYEHSIWCNNAIQIRTVFVADSFLQFREGDGFRALLVVEGDHHFIIVQENRIDEGVDEHLAMDLLPHVQLAEAVEPERHKLRADLGLRQLFAGKPVFKLVAAVFQLLQPCVQHCMKAINSAAPNGRMALVVPEGFLFRKDLTKTREYLLNHCQLQSIISLPQGVFLPYTGVKTDIIYATKVNQKIKPSEQKKSFWYFDVKSDGYTLDNHRRKLDTPSDLSKYEEYRKLDKDQMADMLKVGFEKIPLDKVRRNANILVGSRYRIITVHSNYETVNFSDIATLTRGVTYKKQQQTTFRTSNVILPADNITLQGQLKVEKEIFVDDTVSLPDEKRLKKMMFSYACLAGAKTI